PTTPPSPSRSRSPTAPTAVPASMPRAASSSATARRSPAAAAAPSPALGRRSPSSAAPTRPSRAATATATATPSRTPSAPSLTLSESSPLEHVSGSTLYYNPQGSNTASFTVTGTSADADSDLQKLAFPALTGMTGGGDDTTGPYAGTYTWTASTSASGSQTVALAGGPYYTALSVPLTLGNGSDSGAGVDATSGLVERDSATLADGNCGSYSGTWAQVTLTAGADTTVQTGRCYRYRYNVSDNVGNASTPSAATADAKVDTSAPSVGVSLSESSGLEHVAVSTLYYIPHCSNSASFTVDASGADAESWVEKLTFPTIAGLTGGGDDSSSPYGASYTWDSTTTASGAKTVTGRDNAGLTA